MVRVLDDDSVAGPGNLGGRVQQVGSARCDSDDEVEGIVRVKSCGYAATQTSHF